MRPVQRSSSPPTDADLKRSGLTRRLLEHWRKCEHDQTQVSSYDACSKSTIEKTMTPAQLYEVDCPLWCEGYSIEQLGITLLSAIRIGNRWTCYRILESKVIPNIILQNVSKCRLEISTVIVNMYLKLCHTIYDYPRKLRRKRYCIGCHHFLPLGRKETNVSNY